MNVTGPVFDYKGKEYLVQSSKECRLWLLDTSALGGEDHRTPVYRSPLICNEDVNFAATGTWGALATWEEANGTRWILVPFWGPKHSQFTAPIGSGDVVRGGVAAFKMEDKAGKVVLTPAWLSRDMDQAEPPVVANGVVFAYGSGENTAQADVDSGLGFNTAANRVAKSTHATICARCAHGQGTLVERRSDHLVQSLQRAVGRQRPRLPRHLRRDVVLLRHRQRGGVDERPVARGGDHMKPGSKTHTLIGAIVIASASGAAIARGARPRRRRVDDQPGRRPAVLVGEDGCQAHQGRRAERRAEVSLEDEARQRDASAQFADNSSPDGSADLAPWIQGARVHRRERGARLRGRYRSGARVLDDHHQLLVDHAASQQFVGMPWWVDGGDHASDGFCRLRFRRWQRRRARRRIGELGRRTRQRSAEPGACSQAGQGRGAAPSDPAPAGRGAAPGDPAPAGRGAAPAAQAGRGGGGGGLGGGPNDNIFVVASDGYARTINPHNGSDRVPPVPFLPANARPSDLVAVDGVLYTTTSNGCGAAPNGVWAIDLAGNPKTPVSWKTNGGNVAGAAGLTMGTDGTIFVAVGDGSSLPLAPRPRAPATRTRSFPSSRKR